MLSASKGGGGSNDWELKKLREENSQLLIQIKEIQTR